jgi:hypothetical protein
MFFNNSSVVSILWLPQKEQAVTSEIPFKYRLIAIVIATAIVAALASLPGGLGAAFDVATLS